MTIVPKSDRTKKIDFLQKHADANVSGSSSEKGSATLDDSQLTTENLDEQQEMVMFLGITLNKEQRSLPLSVGYAESTVTGAVDVDSEGGNEVVIESAIFHLKNVCLDRTAKPGERNVIEVEVEGKDGRKERYSIASLSLGVLEMGNFDIQLDVTNKATIHLAQGSGPIHITGQQEFIYDFDHLYEAVEDPSATEDSEGSDEELTEEELKLIKKSKKSSPSQPIKRKKGMESHGKKKLLKREAGDSEEAMSEDEPLDDSGSGEVESEVESPPPKPKRKGKASFPTASTSKQTKAVGPEAKKRQAGRRGEKKN